jgi:hypothetical protein
LRLPWLAGRTSPLLPDAIRHYCWVGAGETIDQIVEKGGYF